MLADVPELMETGLPIARMSKMVRFHPTVRTPVYSNPSHPSSRIRQSELLTKQQPCIQKNQVFPISTPIDRMPEPYDIVFLDGFHKKSNRVGKVSRKILSPSSQDTTKGVKRRRSSINKRILKGT